jgi:flagellar protein FlaJ
MFEKISYKIFGRLVTPYVDYFDSLKQNIKKAGIKIPVDVYFSLIAFSAFISLIFVILFGSIFITIIIPEVGYSYTLAIIAGLVTSTLVFVMGYYYPSIRAQGNKNKIDKALPFAVFYMATSSASGISATEIFRMLSLKKGPVAEDARKIYTNVRSMGMSLGDSIQRIAQKTPSPEFADLLWGMVSLITTGGDIQVYLSDKTKSFMNQYRRSLNDYAKAISLYTEIYITLIIVGSLLFIVLIAIISPIGGGGVLFIQTFIVFLLLPLVSIGFIVLLKGISPTE